MRLFFAFMPSDEIADQIEHIREALPVSDPGRPVARNNLHVTLVFRGEVPNSEFRRLTAFAVVQRAQEFEIAFDRLEFWKESAAIVMTASAVPPPLKEFWTRFQVGLSLPLRDEFRPHVTLVRKVSQDLALQAIPIFRWTPRSFSLVRSDTGGAQSAYTVLDTWPLLYDEQKNLESQ